MPQTLSTLPLVDIVRRPQVALGAPGRCADVLRYRSSMFCGALPRNSSGMWVLVTLSRRTRCCRRFFSWSRAAQHIEAGAAPNSSG